MWGIVPAAGSGTRIQPLAFSKELLPVGSRLDGTVERPRAISEHLIERMLLAGVTKLCIVVAPGKSDILQYYGGQIGGARICYLVQRESTGLCDAIFQAAPFIGPDEHVIVGLPDTLWFPVDALTTLDAAGLSFLLFPVDRPELFDAVVTAPDGSVSEIQVKSPVADTRWIWGAFRLTGTVFHQLHDLWSRRTPRDEYIGSLVNAWLAQGGRATAVRGGESYVDVGTMHGYRAAMELLAGLSNAMVPGSESRFRVRVLSSGSVPVRGSGSIPAESRDRAPIEPEPRTRTRKLERGTRNPSQLKGASV